MIEIFLSAIYVFCGTAMFIAQPENTTMLTSFVRGLFWPFIVLIRIFHKLMRD